jgi:dihydrodipicolinate synthase/N-acetylneuraminate lyase
VVAELAQHPNIVAIKDSSGSLERLAALVAALASSASVLFPAHR